MSKNTNSPALSIAPSHVWGLLNTKTGRIHAIHETRRAARGRKKATDRVVRLDVNLPAKGH